MPACKTIRSKTLRRGWPLTHRDRTIVAVVDGSFLFSFAGTFTGIVCGRTNVGALVNSDDENKESSNDGWRSNAARIAELSAVTNNLTARWRRAVKLHNPVGKAISQFDEA